MNELPRALSLAVILAVSACSSQPAAENAAAADAAPPLAGADIGGPFTLTGEEGTPVSNTDFAGKYRIVYFGYTFCPDVCPTTLLNIAKILKDLGPEAKHVRVLFVTVDPNRDTPQVLKQYVAAFSPRLDGLRGTPDQLASLAKRYRVVYSVSPAHGDVPYSVTHSSAVYVFDGSGKLRLLVSGLATTQPPIAGTVDDLRRLITETKPPGFWDRLWRMV